MKVFNCLDVDQSIEGKIFIEASAGTGKTFAIEHIVRRLVLKGIPLKRILITTFTKKGVRDLKRRIYENLQEALAQAKIGSEEALTLENNLALIEEAQIHTIHSFCHRSLSEFAFEVGLSLTHEDPESEEKQSEVHSAILDTLRTTLDDQEFSPAQLMRLMSHFQRDVQKLVKKISSFLGQDTEIADYLPYTTMKSSFDRIIHSLDKELLKSDLYALATIHKKCADRSGTLFPFIEKQIESIENFEELIASSPSIFSLLSNDNMKSGKSARDLSLHYKNEIELLKPLVLESADPLITFMRLATKAKARVDLIAMKNPNYLLDAMLAKIDNKLFCNLLKSKYSSIIIDEFQDTDPKQWTIFSSLFFHSADPFVVVGDPKQSIYGFRGADLGTYLKAKESFFQTYLLTTNYRSSKSLIHALNRIFNQEKITQTFSLPYEPITAGKDLDDSVGLLAITTTKGEDQILQFVANEICRLKNEEGRPLSDCAILVKDRFQASRMTKVLEEKNISYLSTATDTIIDCEAFRFVELSLKIAANVRDTSLFNQFLLHPFVGWPLEMISTDLNDPKLSDAITKFSALQMRFSAYDASTFLRALLNETFYERPIIENAARDGQTYNDLMQTIELIFNQDRNSPLDAIARLRKRNDLEAPSLKRRPLNDSNSVYVMTMHMSKGLEFEIVFPIGIIAPSKAKQEFTKSHQQKIIRFAADHQDTKNHLNALDQEKMRLFYVALTRAKSRLLLPFCIEEKKSPTKLGTASPAELFLASLTANKTLSQEEVYDQISTLTIDSVTEALANLSLEAKNIDHENFDLNIQQESSKDNNEERCIVTLNETSPRMTSFSSLAKKSHTFTTPIEKDETLLPYGAHTGNIFHLLFEKIIENGLYYPWKEEAIKALIENDLSYTHLNEWKKEAFNVIYTAFHTQIDGFSLCDVPPENMLQESSFFFNLKENVNIKGFVDLVFFHQEKFYILDWKMNYLPEYTQESLDKAMDDHDYKKQAAIYARALEIYTSNLTSPHSFGGSIYFFLRGGENGLYLYKPEKFDLQLILGGAV